MGRGAMKRLAAIAAIGTLMACGHGGGGSGIAASSVDWGIPFVPSSASRTMVVCLRNVSGGSTSATLQGYKPDGSLYTGPVTVTLDGNDENCISVSTALGGDVPAGGFVLVHTASATVEVGFNVTEPGKVAEESSRAWPLHDLSAPPPTTNASVTITTETDLVQLSNATAAPIVVAVTAYQEPSSDPLLPPTVSTPAPIPLAAWESKTLTPAAISGIGGFVGALAFTSPSPFFAAIEEDLAFDGVPKVTLAARTVFAALDFGADSAFPVSYTDFVMIVRNDADSARTVSIDDIRADDGTAVLPSPRAIVLAARESRVITTLDPPLVDLFGDATLEPGISRVWIQASVPADVDFVYRQFDLVALSSSMTVRPQPLGHVFDTLEVTPTPTLPSGTRTIATILNPATAPITVTVNALIPQPDGFDAGPTLLATITVPARSTVLFSPDGTLYLDRDAVAVSVVGLQFVSNTAFTVTGRRETRNGSGVLVMLSPMLLRDLDDSK